MSGFLLGLFSGIFWSIDTVLLSYSTLIILLTAFIHDGFGFLLLSIKSSFSKTSNFKNIIKSDSFKIVIFAGLIGGPIGMGSYIIAISLIGPALATCISITYPVIAALLARFLLKEKLNLIGKIGLFIAIVSTILLYSLNIKFNISILGFVFALITALSWGSECVIIKKAFIKDSSLSEFSALCIRQGISFTIYCFIAFIYFLYTDFNTNFQVKDFNIVFLASIFGTISYLFYYAAIKKIGVLKAMGLNISYSAWTVLIMFFINGEFMLTTFILALFIITGSMLTNINNKG